MLNMKNITDIKKTKTGEFELTRQTTEKIIKPSLESRISDLEKTISDIKNRTGLDRLEADLSNLQSLLVEIEKAK